MNAIAQSFLCLVSIASLVQPSLHAQGELTAPQPPLMIRGDGAHAEVKCRLSGGWLLVPVEIDGAKAWFKIGTGWGTTQVDRKFANTARLRPLPRLGLLQNSMRKATGADREPIFVRGGRFRCGDADAECVWLGVRELGDLAQQVKLPIDGVLGWDFLRQVCFTIDYTVPSVTWHRAGAFKAPEQVEKLDLRNGANFPVVPCAVGNANGWAVVNTATQMLQVDPGFVCQNPGSFTGPSIGGFASSGLNWNARSQGEHNLLVQGARAWGWSRRVPLTLGTVGQETAAALDWNQPEDCDMTIGFDLLRDFRVTFDGPGGAIWLEPAAKTPELAAAERTGQALNLLDLNRAVPNDDVEAAMASLKNGGKIIDGKWKDKDVSPLVMAIRYRATKCTNAFMENGTPVEPASSLEIDTPLQIAAELGDVPLIKRLLKAGSDPRRKTKGFDALARAAGSGSMEAVQALMPKAGLTQEDAARGLAYAAWGGNARIIELFMKPLPASPDISRQVSAGLVESCLFGHVAAARSYLSHGAAADGFQELPITPLLAALIPGPPEKNAAVKRELLELLLKAGAVPNLTRKGISPLLMAAEFGDAETIQLLLKAGGKATDTDYRGTGALACAARGRQPAAVVKLLVDAGAEVDRVDANDQTPLMAFAGFGDIATCKVLLDAGADVNVTSMMSASVITQAANSSLCREEQAAAMVTYLKSRGAKVTASRYEINGPLTGAIGSGRAAVVESVIKAGGDPNQDFGAGLRSLHLAAAGSNRAVVGKLIDLGADLKALDKASVSVLGHAAAAGRTDIIAILLERGLPPDGPDASVAPLGLAVEGSQLAAVRQLLAAGAKPNARSAKTGKTILQVSIGDPQIREVLLAAGAREE